MTKHPLTFRALIATAVLMAALCACTPQTQPLSTVVPQEVGNGFPDVATRVSLRIDEAGCVRVNATLSGRSGPITVTDGWPVFARGARIDQRTIVTEDNEKLNVPGDFQAGAHLLAQSDADRAHVDVSPKCRGEGQLVLLLAPHA